MSSSSKLTVLIADDSGFSRKMTARQLPPQFEWEVTHTKNGLEAVNAFREAPADLVVLDLNMPVMGGFEALEHIRELDPGANVIIVTADHGAEHRRRSVLSGARALLDKPLQAEEFARIIDGIFAPA